MVPDEYPLNKKVVLINDEEVTLRELPVSFIVGVESGSIEDGMIQSCVAGSSADEQFVGQMGYSQLERMYNDIMTLSYGDGWKEQAEKSTASKKK